jgi:hypothetical protein
MRRKQWRVVGVEVSEVSKVSEVSGEVMAALAISSPVADVGVRLDHTHTNVPDAVASGIGVTDALVPAKRRMPQLWPR